MSQKRILIVHDDAAFVQGLTSGLQFAAPGTEVTNALSAPRALGVVSQAVPDVIVVDAELVGVDGYAFTHQLKADPKTKDTPVVIVSLSPSESSALKARSAGAAAHLNASGPMDQIVSEGRVACWRRFRRCAGAAPAGEQGFAAREPMSAVSTPVSVQPPAPVAAPVAVGVGAATVPAAAATATVPVGAPAPAATAPQGYGAPVPVGDAPAAPSNEPFALNVPKAATGSAPGGSEMPHIDELLRLMLQRGGSDLHLTVGSPPGIRQRGDIVPVEDMKPLTPRDTMEMILGLLSEEQRRRFETELELDFAYSIPGVSRFRANVFQQRNSMGAVFRVIPSRSRRWMNWVCPRYAGSLPTARVGWCS